MVDAHRTIEMLRRLDAATGGSGGARRLAWSLDWTRARELVREMAPAAVQVDQDRAANLWFTLPGRSDDLLVLGSHIDAVPQGGWLDGALGVLAGLEVLRALDEEGAPLPISVAVVDWADEEGARFGRSLFGSSAFTGALNADELAELADPDGHSAMDVLRQFDVRPETFSGPDPRLERVRAYLELHIEQGPVLAQTGRSVAAVTGTVGAARDRLVFTGRSSHAGSTPMDARHDAFLAAAATALLVESIAIGSGAVATTGRVEVEPGFVTAIPGRVTLYVDVRHDSAEVLRRLRKEVLDAAIAEAELRGCSVSRVPLWQIAPQPFDPRLVRLARNACAPDSVAPAEPMLSGALHDASALALVVPAVMIFCASIGGLSHCPEEDSHDADLELAVQAFDRLTRAAIETAFA